jgi:hypothetical protein
VAIEVAPNTVGGTQTPGAAQQLPQQGVSLPVDCPCERDVPNEPRRYRGEPIPAGLLIALGDRRTGQWSIGLATSVVLMVLLYSGFAGRGIPGAAFWSVVLASMVGVAAGLFMSNRAAAIQASTEPYPEQESEIRERCSQAWSRLASIVSTDAELIRRSLRRLDDELKRTGPQWLDGAGYLDAWSHIHEAEESLLPIDTDTNIAAAALNDLLRLNNSDIGSKEKLADELKQAIPHLSANSGSNLNPPAPQPVPSDPSTAKQRIKNVRIAINEDREGKWRQVLKARNGLGLGVLAASLITYVMVAVAIDVGINPHTLISAGVFFAVGAAVSMAHQLALRAKSQSEVEDFGYANVKLLVAPVLSGLVAVLAVAILARASIPIGSVTYGQRFQSWQATFDWIRNPDAIWVAAVFGFAPSLLFAILQANVDGVLKSLKSSQSSGGKDKSKSK